MLQVLKMDLEHPEKLNQRSNWCLVEQEMQVGGKVELLYPEEDD